MEAGKKGQKAAGRAKATGMAIQFAAAAAQKIGSAIEDKGMEAAERGEGTGMMAASGRALSSAG